MCYFNSYLYFHIHIYIRFKRFLNDPSLSEFDREDLAFAVKHSPDTTPSRSIPFLAAVNSIFLAVNSRSIPFLAAVNSMRTFFETVRTIRKFLKLKAHTSKSDLVENVHHGLYPLCMCMPCMHDELFFFLVDGLRRGGKQKRRHPSAVDFCPRIFTLSGL